MANPLLERVRSDDEEKDPVSPSVTDKFFPRTKKGETLLVSLEPDAIIARPDAESLVGQTIARVSGNADDIQIILGNGAILLVSNDGLKVIVKVIPSNEIKP